MNGNLFVNRCLNPALDHMVDICKIGRNPIADLNIMAIGYQESDMQHRFQITNGTAPGPAKGYFQFELGTPKSRAGVHGIYLHDATKTHLKNLCSFYDVEFEPGAIHRAIEGHDWLAVCCARLLLWTDPFKLPTEEGPAWKMYADRLWRPGKPHPEKWSDSWAKAQIALNIA